jgi:alkaline phosphatase
MIFMIGDVMGLPHTYAARGTLVVITADHETGGITIVGGDKKSKSVKLAFSTTGHSAVMVPNTDRGNSPGLTTIPNYFRKS